MKRIISVLPVLVAFLALSCQKDNVNRTSWLKANQLQGTYHIASVKLDGYPQVDLNNDGSADSDAAKELVSVINYSAEEAATIRFSPNPDASGQYEGFFSLHAFSQDISDLGPIGGMKIGYGDYHSVSMPAKVLSDGSLAVEIFTFDIEEGATVTDVFVKDIRSVSAEESEKGIHAVIENYPVYDYLTEAVYYGTCHFYLEKD